MHINVVDTTRFIVGQAVEVRCNKTMTDFMTIVTSFGLIVIDRPAPFTVSAGAAVYQKETDSGRIGRTEPYEPSRSGDGSRGLSNPRSTTIRRQPRLQPSIGSTVVVGALSGPSPDSLTPGG